MSTIQNRLPQGWIEISLNDLMAHTASIAPKNTPAKMFELWSVPSFESDDPEYVTGAEVGSNKQKVSPGDVLLCKINPRINRVWLVKDKKDFDQIASTEWIVLRSRAHYPPFLLYQLREDVFRQRLLEDLSGIGGSLTRARPRIVGHLKVKLAPPDEQKRIVARIEKLQARSRRAREALEAIPDLLDQLRQSILAAAFRGDLTKEWRKRHPNVEPASELLKRIRAERRKHWEEAELEKLKAIGLSDDKLHEAFANRRKQYKEPALVDLSQLPKLPKGWTWCWLSEMGYMNRGKSKHRPRNASHLYGGEYPFIQTGDIAQSRGRITNHRQTYSKAGLMQSQLWPEGTICITIAANIASTAILTYPACFPDSVVGITTDDQLCKSEYVEFFIRTKKKDLAQFAPATAQKNINIDILKRVVMPLAPRLEVEAIVELLETTYSNIENTEIAFKKNIEQLILIDQAILSKAFRGELVPQDPNDDPASNLLERIRQEKARAVTVPKVKDKRKDKKMHHKQKEQQDVLAVLRESGQALTPEEVFSAAGFDEASVDIFYEQLRAVVSSKQVREIKEGKAIRLEAIVL